MGRAGEVVRLPDEPLIEPAMALMSCGPAFMALVAESFAEAGRPTGSSPRRRCAWWWRPWAAPPAAWPTTATTRADLRARVATPGGTTEKGLIRLEESGLRELARATVDAVVEATR